MRIYKTKNYDEMSRKAANIISAQMILKPESVLGLATGSSPIGTYNQLINWYKKGDLDFSQITASIWMNTKDLTHPIRKATLISCVTIFLIM